MKVSLLISLFIQCIFANLDGFDGNGDSNIYSRMVFYVIGGILVNAVCVAIMIGIALKCLKSDKKPEYKKVQGFESSATEESDVNNFSASDVNA
mmetsp:Transcript_42686/g.52520  ORF Transcript_42686/g.52520 Transcript_42686/m.52520 type:complete len:94 (-) Transcript_42686:22-303(-)